MSGTMFVLTPAVVDATRKIIWMGCFVFCIEITGCRPVASVHVCVIMPSMHEPCIPDNCTCTSPELVSAASANDVCMKLFANVTHCSGGCE